MVPAVFYYSRVSILVTWGIGIIRALTWLFLLEGLEFPLDNLNNLLHRLHCDVLGLHVDCLRWQLVWQVSICVSEVSHCHPVLCRCLSEVCEGFLYAHQVVGSVAALTWVLLPLLEAGMCLNVTLSEHKISGKTKTRVKGNFTSTENTKTEEKRPTGQLNVVQKRRIMKMMWTTFLWVLHYVDTSLKVTRINTLKNVWDTALHHHTS